MSAISTIDEYSVGLRDKYWEVVKTCLIEIFEMEAVLAEDLAFELRQNFEHHVSPSEQLLIYHHEALVTAAYISFSALQETDEQREKYREICQRLGWTPEDVA